MPIYAMGQIDENVEFLIKNSNGDRIESQNIKLVIYDEKNNEIENLMGYEPLMTTLSKNHRYQVDVYMSDYLVSSEYFYFDRISLVNLTVPNSHGVVFSASYSDGKPMKSVEVSLFTNKNTKISTQTTDIEGKTVRMWVPPTVKTDDYYKVIVQDGNLNYSEDKIYFQPGEQSQYSIMVPWPSVSDSLIEIELMDNTGKKIDDSGFTFSLSNKKSGAIYTPTSIIKGNVFISKIPFGEYSVLMSDENANNISESEFFQIGESEKFSIIFPNYSQAVPVVNEEIQKTGITCNCVAFRLDDVQNHWLNDVQIAVMEVFRETQNPLTIGVIAKGINEDEKIKNYINSRLDAKPELEIANHSWDNTRYTDLSLEEQNKMLKQSNDKIKEVFSISPKVFIPPQNAFNDNTINVLKSNKYTHFSSEFDFSTPPFPLKGEKIYQFPGGAETGHLNKELKLFIGLDSQETLKGINTSLSNYGFAVVVMHPQEFSMVKDGSYVNEIDENQIKELKDLLSSIRSEGLRVVPLGKINLGASVDKEELPIWLKSTAGWWGKNQISDREFIDGIHYLIQNKIITVADSTESYPEGEIPSWVRNNARWWANNQISNEEFVRGLQYMVDSNIIQLT